MFIRRLGRMRGVVALAAAISLPKLLADGSPFPARNIIIFLTFCVIFVTLVGQGLTLPFFIRKLGLAASTAENPEEQRARYAMIDAALAYLEASRDADPRQFATVYDELIRIQKHHVNLLPGPRHADTGYTAQEYELYLELTRSIRALQRAALLNLRNQNKIRTKSCAASNRNSTSSNFATPIRNDSRSWCRRHLLFLKVVL